MDKQPVYGHCVHEENFVLCIICNPTKAIVPQLIITNKMSEIKSVQAKFIVSSIEEDTWSKTVKMSAVNSGEGDNKDFNSATPSGNLEIQIHGEVPAANFFEIGKEYYMDFTKAE